MGIPPQGGPTMWWKPPEADIGGPDQELWSAMGLYLSSGRPVADMMLIAIYLMFATFFTT